MEEGLNFSGHFSGPGDFVESQASGRGGTVALSLLLHLKTRAMLLTSGRGLWQGRNTEFTGRVAGTKEGNPSRRQIACLVELLGDGEQPFRKSC